MSTSASPEVTRVSVKRKSNPVVKQSKIIRLDKDGSLDESSLSRVTSILQADGVVAVPTDTLYGLAGLAQSDQAIDKIYGIKDRHNEKPLAICVAGVDQVHEWAQVRCKNSLLEDLLPGPVTLLFERSPTLNPSLNPGVSSIGIRVPDRPFIRALCRALDAPLALTSANASGARSTLRVEEFEYLWPKIDLIIDGGPINGDDDDRVGEVNGHDDKYEENSSSKRRRTKSSPDVKSDSSSSPSSSSSLAFPARLGSTVVDLTREARFRIIRPGESCMRTRDILKLRYGMEEDE